MPRTISVYPQAHLEGTAWKLVIDVGENQFTHTATSTVAATTPLSLMKVVFRLTVGDTDTDQDVDDALTVDDIRPGPQTETVWGNIRDLAESIITGLTPGYTNTDFQAAWRTQDTSAVRSDAHRALVNQRGWTISEFHQHEGDNTVLEG